jgi:hypothetical protein
VSVCEGGGRRGGYPGDARRPRHTIRAQGGWRPQGTHAKKQRTRVACCTREQVRVREASPPPTMIPIRLVTPAMKRPMLVMGTTSPYLQPATTVTPQHPTQRAIAYSTHTTSGHGRRTTLSRGSHKSRKSKGNPQAPRWGATCHPNAGGTMTRASPVHAPHGGHGNDAPPERLGYALQVRATRARPHKHTNSSQGGYAGKKPRELQPKGVNAIR